MQVEFTEFLDGIHGNSRKYLNEREAFTTLLQQISQTYEDVLALRPLTHRGPILFTAMAHASYLASVQLSTSGQLPTSYMASRGTLEASIYGWWVNKRPELKKIWSSRHESEAAKQLVKNSFKIGEIRTALRRQQPAIEHQFGDVYDRTIDMGAHPNSLALWTNMTEPDDEGMRTWQYVNPEEPARTGAVQTAAFSGLTGLTVFLDAFADAFRPTLIPAKIVNLTQRLFELFPE